jgi:hypothetical protein
MLANGDALCGVTGIQQLLDGPRVVADDIQIDGAVARVDADNECIVAEWSSA